MKRRERQAIARRAPSKGADWYKDAVIYEVRTRSFFDSNGDGIGDLRGLAAKLDYLADLGVSALWLLPFYPSPLKDGAYDISDYMDVAPEIGTLDDFKHLVDEVHARGMRIITELVLNHTSDQHPWFQQARRAPPDSPERAFYVWSASPKKYQDARIIFKDFETSNWTWDPIAKEYYWHRFYSHQPDLNFENPAVHKELFAVVDFWLSLGVDGLRLDAVPYLYEEEGTNCENLPQTHAFLRALRAHIDARFADRMLLAEANQWPEDAAAYFGNGDECHMNFHFPLMPRMFMAIDMEDRFPIVDILAQTPTPPGTSQWALFLRNHDELTLEMVTDDERDYMYRAYATEPSARINLGIRRRLAPLMGNDRRKIELLNGLLLALPGTPVLYYGDEIGMGDNVFLGDRDGVRTPMQWNMDRNAGFSSANPQKLVLPVNIDSAFHYATLNVETQENNPSSLLWWTKRMVAARREFLAFGRGTIEILHPSNPKVLAFVRLFEDEVILVVANLSRSVQCVELALGAYEGLRPIELFGRTEFPAIQATPYFLTLSGHAFYWLSLKRGAARSDKERLSAYGPPIVDRRSFIGQGRSGDRALVDDALPGFLESRPWFPKHGRSIAQAATVDVVPLQEGLTLLLARIDYESRESELYPIFLRFVPAHEPGEEHGAPVSPLVRLRDGGSGAIAGCLVDALDDAATARTLLAAVAGRLDTPPSSDSVGVLKGTTVGEIDLTALGDPQPVPGKRANVIVQFDERYVLKTLRRTDEETPPELEVARHLSQRGFAHAPPVLGSLEYLRRGKRPVTLAIVERHVDNAETAWQKALSELARYYERVLTTHRDAAAPPAASVSPATLSATSLPPIVRELMGSFHESLTLLGRRTAELHRELSQGDEAAFTPEPYSAHDRRSDYQSLRNLAGEVLRRLQSLPPETPAGAQADAELALEHWGTVLKRFAPLLTDRSALVRIRCQGALDLEQIVFTGKDYVFLDQSRGWDISLHERRRKRLALRDLASLVRSMDLASVVALSESSTLREADRPAVAGWSRFWSAEATFALVAGYREAAAGSRLVPGSADALATLLDVFVLESTLRETLADLDEPTPDVGYPLHALRRVLEIA